MHNHFSPMLRQRAISLIVGPAHLGLLTLLFSHMTDVSIGVTAVVVAGCATVVLVAIGILCVRFARRKGGETQFSMATALLLFIPFGVYLGAIRCVLLAIDDEELDPITWFLFAAYCVLFMVITTVVLLYFGEALVWLATCLRKATRARPGNGLRSHIDRADPE